MNPLIPGSRICSKCHNNADRYRPPSHHLPPGTVLHDRYVIGRAMGEGGFGITYIGYDPVLEIRAAIKEYYPVERCTRNSLKTREVELFAGISPGSFMRGREKFLREARILAKMDKQKVIVGVRDYFEENNTAYIVMEYIEGTTFTDLVRERGGRILPGELFSITEPLFEALSELHKSGLIHRDICPDNLMLENGQIRLLDFGCARETAKSRDTLTITLRHGYAPIEQYQQSGGQGTWTDIYALSATFYYCLTGTVPPHATNRITKETLRPLRNQCPELTPRLEKVLLKGMALRPHQRYRTMEDLHDAIYAGKTVSCKKKTARFSAEKKIKSGITAVLTGSALAAGKKITIKKSLNNLHKKLCKKSL